MLHQGSRFKLAPGVSHATSEWVENIIDKYELLHRPFKQAVKSWSTDEQASHAGRCIGTANCSDKIQRAILSIDWLGR